MVLPSRQSLVKSLPHDPSKTGVNALKAGIGFWKLPVCGACIKPADGRTEFATRCIAIWPELWFDGLGFPSRSRRLSAEEPP